MLGCRNQAYEIVLKTIARNGLGVRISSSAPYIKIFMEMIKISKKRWKSFSTEEIEKIVSESHSFSEVANRLGYSSIGGSSVKSVEDMCLELNLDTKHFGRTSWNKGKYDYERYKEGTYIGRGKTARQALISKRGNVCQCCGNSEWLGEPIKLNLHHIDEDVSNNSEDNLILVCSNCHRFIHDHSEKHKKYNTKQYIPDDIFIKTLKESNSVNEALGKLGLVYGIGNFKRAYKLIYKNNIQNLM